MCRNTVKFSLFLALILGVALLVSCGGCGKSSQGPDWARWNIDKIVFEEEVLLPEDEVLPPSAHNGQETCYICTM